MAAENESVGFQLSFALYGAANRMVRLHKPFLEPLGLTFPQYLVLLELLNGSPRTVGDLGLRLGMDTAMLTPLLKRLQIAGLVTRVRDVNDERRVQVDVTDKSRVIEPEVRAVHGQIKSACGLDEAGMIDLRRTLEALGHTAVA